MFLGKKVAVIIPAYRVERFVAQVIEGIPGYVDSIVVVDDGSPDGTSQVVRALTDPRVKLIRRESNGGVGAAMKTGFRHALEAGDDVMVKIDGDGQMDPRHIPGLIYPIINDECDYAKGNRFGWGSTAPVKMPTLRRIGSQVLTFLTKAASGYWHVFDPQNGYLAVRGSVLRRLPLDAIDDGYFFENSMLINLNILEARVADVHMPAIYGSESSSLRIGRVAAMFPFKLATGFIRRVFLRYLYFDVSPVAIFALFGLLLLLGGGSFGAYSWYRSIVSDRPVAIGTAALGLAPLLMGFQLLMNAMLLDIQQSPRGPRKAYSFSERDLATLAARAEGDKGTDAAGRYSAGQGRAASDRGRREP